MEQTCHNGGTGVGLIPLLQDEYYFPRVLVDKVYLEVCPWGSYHSEYLHRWPKPGKGSRKWHPVLCWCPVPIPIPPPPPPPPSTIGGAVGCPCRSQLRVSAADGPWANRPQGRICTQGNLTPGRVSTYMRVPIPSLDECRPLLTMLGVCVMSVRPCSPSFPRWYRGTFCWRGPSGRWTLPEGGHFLTTWLVCHRRRKDPIGSGLTFPGPVRLPTGVPPLLSPSFWWQRQLIYTQID